jgi:hypothetical protein
MRPIWCEAQSELVSRLRSTNFSAFIELQPAAVN